jgi:hypothetical protein
MKRDQVKEFSCALAALAYVFSLAEEEHIYPSLVFQRMDQLFDQTGRKFQHVSR